ncbi:MAG: hypothetical protein AB7T49_06700 [Oligoflexales bacterium]
MRLFFLLVHIFWSNSALSLPTVCSVINTPMFGTCLQFTTWPTVCGYPSRPCIHFSYYVPQFYIEVVSNPGESFFATLPSAKSQLSSLTDRIPFAAEEDSGAFSYHAHTINVPFTSASFNFLPCGGAPPELTCFGAMSEHLGRLWKTGEADLNQPLFLAWSAAPKACLVTGAATSITGESSQTGYPTYPTCSFDRSSLTTFPPSNQPVCTGWGIHFPRYGTVTNADQTTASLMIASRIKSLGSEVFQAVPSSANEKWQMIYPQPSACFREGENVAFLRTKGVAELGRLQSLEPKNYLYVIWKHVSCTKDMPYLATAQAGLQAMSAGCKGFE